MTGRSIVSLCVFLITAGICTSGALALASTGRAGQPITPTLNPPPPSFETCKASGGGTICQGSIASSYDPVDIGQTCGNGLNAFDVFDSASQNEVAMRIYDANGNLVRRVRHDRADGAVSNQLNGATVPYSQTQNITDDLAVPGDFGSATETTTGQIHFRLAHGAPLVIGAGRTVFAPNGTLEFQAGPTGLLDLLAGAPSATEPICAALR